MPYYEKSEHGGEVDRLDGIRTVGLRTRQCLSNSRRDVVRSERFASSYVENIGDGKFTIRDLPMEAQVAPVNDIAVGDYNNDGTLDALLVGNDYTADVATGRYDASEGLYLRGDGQGNFVPKNAQENGFRVSSDARSIKSLTLANGQSLWVVGSNSDSLRAFVNGSR